MAVSANTTRPLRFLRRLSGNMEPPVYDFPVIETTTTWRKGDAAKFAAAADGGVTHCTGAGTAIGISTTAGAGLVGFFYGASSDAPVFPTSAGVQGTYISPSSITANSWPPPANTKIAVVLALPDCIFQVHGQNNNTDITAPTRTTLATGGLFYRVGLCTITPTGETERVMLDFNVTTTGIAKPIRFSYPQLPQARSSTANADPYQMVLGASGTSNPSYEVYIDNSVWNPSV